MPVTKNEVADAIYAKLGLTKKRCTEVTELILDLMKERLIDGETVKISGFGNFVVNQKKSRVGRNPQTGEEIEISARKVVTFAPSQVLKERLNGG
ncbi:MAG: integration host factor subunit alpha [Deferrisomatales bacterium]|nr:integration host factor subunit alpha [Deferrisomatales bacterium]